MGGRAKNTPAKTGALDATIRPRRSASARRRRGIVADPGSEQFHSARAVALGSVFPPNLGNLKPF